MAATAQAGESRKLSVNVATILTAASKSRITCISIINKGSVDRTVSIYLVPQRETRGDEHLIFHSTVKGRESIYPPAWHTMNANAKVEASQSAGTDVSVTVSTVNGLV